MELVPSHLKPCQGPCLHQAIHGSHPRRRGEEVWKAIALLATRPLVEETRLGNHAETVQLQRWDNW